jgi:glutamate/tyrosine decarboxylase-like PLP-dependent enzyme
MLGFIVILKGELGRLQTRVSLVVPLIFKAHKLGLATPGKAIIIVKDDLKLRTEN